MLTIHLVQRGQGRAGKTRHAQSSIPARQQCDPGCAGHTCQFGVVIERHTQSYRIGVQRREKRLRRASHARSRYPAHAHPAAAARPNPQRRRVHFVVKQALAILLADHVIGASVELPCERQRAIAIGESSRIERQTRLNSREFTFEVLRKRANLIR